jgi:hypothetical protein
MTRRDLLKAAAGASAIGIAAAAAPSAVSLFDGKTLAGWIPLENGATSVPGADILDAASLAKKLTEGTDAMSVFLRGRLSQVMRADLASYSPDSTNAKAVISGLTKDLNQLLWETQFPTVGQPPETARLRGWELARLNKTLLERAYPRELAKSATNGWVVHNGAMRSIGAGRGVLYTKKDYGRFRLAFTMRHVSGNPDHQACVLIFCTRPSGNDKPLDALGGIQFQVPNGGHWDYRPGMNNNGGAAFTSITKTKFDVHEWSRVEIVADASTGTARMTVAQPVESQAVDVLEFRDPAAGKPGPIAWQMHNAGLIDEYKDVTVEEG